MREFVKTTGAVALGTLLASGVALTVTTKVMLNKKFLRAYTKKAMEISKEITEELIEDMYEE